MKEPETRNLEPDASGLRTGRWAGFTLLEMMLVLAILGILIGLVFSGVQFSKTRAAKTRARAEVRDLAKAWKAYWTTYNTWPAGMSGLREMDASAMKILQGDNPRGLVFMDVANEATAGAGYFDPWRTRYRVDFSRTVTKDQFEYYQTTVNFPNRKRYWDDIQAGAEP